MAILEGDIKLLKSAVMADTSDGGGAMTGLAVIDGQSNNLFPDTSEVDRALGRVNLRKVFGVAHTSNTDTLLGAHAIITDAPDDPLVHCTLMTTDGWADTRDVARSAIEKYLVKGPRLQVRVLDTHFAGSLILRLYTPNNGGDFPVGGDAVVLRTPSGTEQYIRILRTSTATNKYTDQDGTTFTAVVVTCDLGQALAFDFVGAPMAKTLAGEFQNYSSVYSTTIAAGTRFYGIKPLATDGHIGDYSATTLGGIYTPLVPAATIETPIIDVFPLTGRGAVIASAYGALTVAGSVAVLGAASILKAPSAIKPASISLSHNTASFTDDGTGNVLQGTTFVGSVDYGSGVITFAGNAPSYGSYTSYLTYTPATSANAASFSSEFLITSANQGLSYTNVFNPLPAPGSFKLSFMAQGRWYELLDNNVGKLVGRDSSYGVGTLSYTTGSMAVTLGALPDIGSVLIAEWGDPDSALKIASTLPTRLHADLDINARSTAANITVSWSRGGTNYVASSDSTGVLSGEATGSYKAGILSFEPNVFPDGVVTVAHKYGASQASGFLITSDTGTSASIDLKENSGSPLANLPVRAGTLSFTVPITVPNNVWGYSEATLAVYDRNGVLYANYGPYGTNRTVTVGSVNYATGSLTVLKTVTMVLATITTETPAAGGSWVSGSFSRYMGPSNQSVSLYPAGITNMRFSEGLDVDMVSSFDAPIWTMGLDVSGASRVVLSNMLFKIGSDLYSSAAGTLRRGWDLSTGVPSAAVAGSVTSSGSITVTSLPSNFTNGVTWYNAAQEASGKSITHGVYRTATAPLKVGVMQLLYGQSTGSGNDAGVFSGFFTGTVDYTRGIVRWNTASGIDASQLSYNAVFLQYLPLEASLLGLETARLPLDGKVPIYRAGGLVVVHNTQIFNLPNPLVKGTVYSLGRVRIAAVKVKTASGATVDSTLYTTDLDAGTITFPANSDLAGLSQPFTVEHRIEDMQLCSQADISGQLTFTRSLTHAYPAGSSYVSSAAVAGDVFARAYNYIEQSTWTGVWSDNLIGSAPLANFNETQNPFVVTNKGAITERWAVIFTGTTAYRVIGQSVGEIATGSTTVDCAPLNPATGVPYFTIPAAGWGSGWATGNVYRFNTAACGTPLWVVRTVLQGPATLLDDKFTLAFRGDVDRA